MSDLPSHLCDTHILSSLEWFGRWKILNIEFEGNRVIIHFQKGLDTREAVRAMHGRYVEVDKRIQVETGHTYYCPAFLKNPDHPDCKRNCTLAHKWINRELFEKLSAVRLWQKRVICVRGLPLILCDEDSIRSWFGKFGEIEDIKLRRQSPILAFLTFYDERDARNAIEMMNGKYYKQHRTRLQVTQSYFLYCRDFLTNGSVHCSGYPRCKRMHRWIHANEMIKPNITPQRQARELEKHIETEDDIDKYAYDGITGCVEDIQRIRLQSANTIIVKGVNDVQSCNTQPLFLKKQLRSNQWFGQFGPIKGVHFFMHVVFVTFVNPNDALKAIAWTRGGKCIDEQVIYTRMKHSPFCWSF
eukprot:433772_1